MIISDLNYLETVSEAGVSGGAVRGLLAGKFVGLKTSVKQDFDTDIDLDIDKNIDIDANADYDVEGNGAITTFDNTALGSDTSVESDVSNFVAQGAGSESTGTLSAFTD